MSRQSSITEVLALKNNKNLDGLLITTDMIVDGAITNSKISPTAAIEISKLQYSSISIGSTSVSLGSTATTLSGLDSVSATTLNGALSGNSSTSTKLQTARTIGITGDATWTSPSFDGSGNVTASLTLATVTDSGTGTFKKITTDTKGRVTGTTSVVQSDITSLLGTGSITNTMLANSAVANLSGTNTGDETSSTIKTKLGITTLSGSNTGDQTIALTGDVTGTGTGSFVATLANSGVTDGTYTKVTVDAKGRVTTGASLLASDVPTLNQNTTGSSASCTGNSTTATTATNLSGGTVSGTNISYTGTLTGGTGVVNIGSGQIYKDASGNVGIGVTPSAWASGKALQVGNTGLLNVGTGTYLKTNNYFDGSTSRYISNGYATSFDSPANGTFTWNTAPSGTAGNAVTFTTAMILDASSNLSVGGNITSNGIGMFGIGQTWQNVTASRAVGVTYTNTTGKPISVNIALISTSSSYAITCTIGGVALRGSGATVANNIVFFSGVVPSGSTYSATTTATASVYSWQELR